MNPANTRNKKRLLKIKGYGIFLIEVSCKFIIVLHQAGQTIC